MIGSIQNSKWNCTELLHPEHLQRDNSKSRNYGISDWKDQEHYVPDPEHGRFYYGIIDQGGELPTTKEMLSKINTPIVPYAATGPYQYVHEVNSSRFNGTIYERCTSVYGEPTRDGDQRTARMRPLNTVEGFPLGGAGRSSETIFIAQPRRQSPGWDGCRDRYDGDMSLPAELMYKHPSQRSDHKAVYIDSLPIHLPGEPHASGGKKGELFLFGGVGHEQEFVESSSTTYDTIVRSDFWRLGIHECVNNCSNHGVCEYGFCQCYDGYYGVDCSNISCPGDFCYYDVETRQQHCQHCCHHGYNHTDDETWIDGIGARKSPCNHVDYGPSNGICDGYGTCQCAPPFLGEDCSIKDCKV